MTIHCKKSGEAQAEIPGVSNNGLGNSRDLAIADSASRTPVIAPGGAKPNHRQEVIGFAKKLPKDCELTPYRKPLEEEEQDRKPACAHPRKANKATYHSDPLTPDTIQTAPQSMVGVGLNLRTRFFSIDEDSPLAAEWLERFRIEHNLSELPETFTVWSGRDGRQARLFRLPPGISLKLKQIFDKSDSTHPILEFLAGKKYQNLYGFHPITGSYQNNGLKKDGVWHFETLPLDWCDAIAKLQGGKSQSFEKSESAAESSFLPTVYYETDVASKLAEVTTKLGFLQFEDGCEEFRPECEHAWANVGLMFKQMTKDYPEADEEIFQAWVEWSRTAKDFKDEPEDTYREKWNAWGIKPEGEAKTIGSIFWKYNDVFPKIQQTHPEKAAEVQKRLKEIEAKRCVPSFAEKVQKLAIQIMGQDSYEALEEKDDPTKLLMSLPEHWGSAPVQDLDRAKEEILKLAVLYLNKQQIHSCHRSGFEFDDKYLGSLVEKEIRILRSQGKTEEILTLSGALVWGWLKKDDPIFYDYLMMLKKFGERLKYNELKLNIELDGQELSLEAIKADLSIDHNFKPASRNKDDIRDAVIKAAKAHAYHPIVDYLEGVHQKYGDDTSILQGVAQRYFGQSRPIYNTMIIKTKVAAVARVFDPGCKVDTIAILQGGQGWLKSTFWRVLAARDDAFIDSLNNSNPTDEIAKMHKHWFCEYAEFETVFSEKALSKVKGFVTNKTDVVRLPYARADQSMQRRFVLVGTTNETEFLIDPTGERRFWIIPVSGKIDIALLKEERDRLWAAAVALYKSGYQWHLTDDEEREAKLIADQFQRTDPWEEEIKASLQGKAMVSIKEILDFNLQCPINQQTQREQKRVSKILTQLGWEKKNLRVDGKQVKRWVPSNEVKAEYQGNQGIARSVAPGNEVKAEYQKNQGGTQTQVEPTIEDLLIFQESLIADEFFDQTEIRNKPVPRLWDAKIGDQVWVSDSGKWKRATVVKEPQEGIMDVCQRWTVEIHWTGRQVVITNSANSANMKPMEVV
ncbi:MULTISPECIES: VapE domain-containing protein [Leptolyngbya]|uniref:VapE domain-containing protein n=1 Tax=Leptolyngbya TaxID=47251 RepID=UPI0016830D07|nr:VapE domain-containing protein [Leptolyngbya sp. FACHB-1624]MBD1856453.1 PriCT-2 domain-containing protein [Leptolyngbya sp. FACHB-1624]